MHIFLLFVLIFAFCFKASNPPAQSTGSENNSDAYELTQLEEKTAITVFEEATFTQNRFAAPSKKPIIPEELYIEFYDTLSYLTSSEEALSDTLTTVFETTAQEQSETKAEPFYDISSEPFENASNEAESENDVEFEDQKPDSQPIADAYGLRYQEQWELDFADELFDIVNSERESIGLPPFKKLNELTAAAAERAREISIYTSHTRPDGTSCFTVLTQYGLALSSRAENIAYYSQTPRAAFNNFNSNYSHSEPMFSTKFDYMGTGFYYSEGNYYWIELFYSF